MQGLEHVKLHSHHHESIFAFWQACVNTKAYEQSASDSVKQTGVVTSQYQEVECEEPYCDDEDSDDLDDDFEMDEELMKHIGCNKQVEITSIDISNCTTTITQTTPVTLTATTIKDICYSGRRFSDCGADLPELSTQPSISSSS